MQNQTAPAVQNVHRLLHFGLYLVGGVLVFFLGVNTFQMSPTNRNALYEWGLTIAFLVLAILFSRSARLRGYGGISFALFAASFGNALCLLLGNFLGSLLPMGSSTMQVFAIDKLSQSISIVGSIVLLTLLAGGNLGSIFLKKGNLREGLKFGLISFGLFAALFTGIVLLQSNASSSKGLFASGIQPGVIVSAIPWILVFVFANGFMEELWFRGVSLRKLTPSLGMFGAVLATALVFGISHIGATYVTPLERYIFPLIVVGLGMVNGYVMLKTDSLWGSVFFHAGYDLLVILPLLA